MSNKTIDILGIGNAMLDISINGVEDQFIEDNALNKAGMILIDKKESERLLALKEPSLSQAGGSVANTISAISALGLSTGFIGPVSNDSFGNRFNESITSLNVNYTPQIIASAQTSHCLVYITHERERSMATHLGASLHLRPQHIDEDKIAQSKYIYLEGYIFDLPHHEAILDHITACCKKHHTQIILSLSDKHCIERNHEQFRRFTKAFVDILFGNEAELMALTNVQTSEQAVTKSRDLCGYNVITLGAKGATVIEVDRQLNIPAVSVERVEDKTGAGDFFAAGFIYNLLEKKGQCAIKSGLIASKSAAYIIQKQGARPNDDYKPYIQTTE